MQSLNKKMTNNRSFYFSDGPYIQVLKALVGALTLPEAFVKLLGNPHTGKSTLCTKLTQYLRRKGVKVIHFDKAIESPDMLRAALAQEFDLPLTANFARILEDALQEQNQKRVILIFDDAHLLTNITLIEIYRLAEVQVNKKRLLNVLLCGEPGSEKRLLSNSEFKSLLLNVSHKFKLEPMNEEELAQSFYRFVEMAGLARIAVRTFRHRLFLQAMQRISGLRSKHVSTHCGGKEKQLRVALY
jgi:general secretion pathway protein A